MPTTPQDTDVVLPHASLPAYFHHSTAAAEPDNSESMPPSYSKCIDSHEKLRHTTSDAQLEDEESKYGFSGEHVPSYGTNSSPFVSAPFKHGSRSTWNVHTFFCYWGAMSICMMVALGIFFVLDLGCSRYGFGTGMAEWVIHGPVQSSMGQHEMRFCLTTLDREAPSPQRWRYLAPGAHYDCTTETVTLLASSSDYLKFHTSDEVLVGDNIHSSNRDKENRKFLAFWARIRVQGLGDNLAEEGKLSRWA